LTSSVTCEAQFEIAQNKKVLYILHDHYDETFKIGPEISLLTISLTMSTFIRASEGSDDNHT